MNAASIAKAGRKALGQPSFLLAFVVLLVAALTLNATTQFLKLHFKKLPVPLARPLNDVPNKLGSWVCISKDQLSEDVEQELNATEYIMRFYVRRSALMPEELQSFEGKDYDQRLKKLNELRAQYKGDLDKSIISLAVTFNTGKADTVAHIPERCYTADGYEPTDSKTEDWDVGTTQAMPNHQPGHLDVRYISFDDQTGRNHVKKNVAYFFHVNGHYESNPAYVRGELANLFAKYGYFAKVELMVQTDDRDMAAESMRDFLHSALPEIEQCWPDWKKISAQGSAKVVASAK
jgi:hypothetical protein